jgi:hypothetical protein
VTNRTWPVPERPREEWNPFMEGLFLRVRRERRRRWMTGISAAACLLLALWMGISFGRGGETSPLRAEVPTTEALIFQPDNAGPSQGPIVMVCAR